MASSHHSIDNSIVNIPFSSRRFIEEISPDQRSKLCTEIDYTIHKNEGYWQKLMGHLGFDETHSKKFKLSFEMHGSPTDNLLRDCSYRMLRIRHLYQVLKEIGLLHLAEAYLKEYDTEEDLSPCPLPFKINSFSSLRNEDSRCNDSLNKAALQYSKGPSWRGLETIHFLYDDIKIGTNNFSPKMELGAGAFGKVYKVMLNSTLFACKVLKIDKGNLLTTSLIEKHQQHDDLRNELNYLAEYRHPNVIALYGWSLDGPDPCLIYEFMKNGSLQDRLQCLNNSKPIDWETRIRVSCGAARGLQFLHTMKSKPLIHGDIKTANILLDNSFTAKLGDFGLAREMPHNLTTESYVRLENEHTPGTLGYLANEYMITKKLSMQVDTYAFGVVLLELYTGRRAYDRTKKNPLLRDYMDDVAKDIENIGEENSKNKLFRLQAPEIPPLSEEIALKFVRLALSCCHEKRKERPKMSQTLAVLNEIDRTLAMANGGVPEEDFPIAGGDVVRALQPRNGLIKSPVIDSDATNLRRNPVESVDHSFACSDHVQDEPHLPKGDKSLTPTFEKRVSLMKINCSSSESEGKTRASADTTRDEANAPDDIRPPDLVHKSVPRSPRKSKQNQHLQFEYYHDVQANSSFDERFSHALIPQPLHSQSEQRFEKSVSPTDFPQMKKIIKNQRVPVDMLYNNGPYRNQENKNQVKLKKIPARLPCTCASCQAARQQNIKPHRHWASQAYCPQKAHIPGNHNGRQDPSAAWGQLNANRASINRQFHPNASKKWSSMQEPYIHNPMRGGLASSAMPPLRVNSVKKLILDKLQIGQTYSDIFPEKNF